MQEIVLHYKFLFSYKTRPGVTQRTPYTKECIILGSIYALYAGEWYGDDNSTTRTTSIAQTSKDKETTKLEP